MLNQFTLIGCTSCTSEAMTRLAVAALAYQAPAARRLLLGIRSDIRHIESQLCQPAFDIESVTDQLTELIDELAARREDTLANVPVGLSECELGAIRELLRDARGPLLAALEVRIDKCLV